MVFKKLDLIDNNTLCASLFCRTHILNPRVMCAGVDSINQTLPIGGFTAYSDLPGAHCLTLSQYSPLAPDS